MQIHSIQPQEVFSYFSQISAIPHGSGNTDRLAEFCLKFAKQNGLDSFRDDYGNVMIFKNGTPGYEQSEPVILQGHMDMVCEKTSDCPIDMDQEGVELMSDGKYLWANGTTLGADNGIAVAYILALLASSDIPHPPLEALLTVDEEVGLRGARELNASYLSGKRLINIDSEQEGVLTAGCAGGVRTACRVPVAFEDLTDDAVCYRISISGLLGGHSGTDIDKPRKNAILVLAMLLDELQESIGIGICEFEAGGRLNVIPQSAYAVVSFARRDLADFYRIVSDYQSELKKICFSIEPSAAVSVEPVSGGFRSIRKENTESILFLLLQSPNGVVDMSPDIPDLVQTSLNLGYAELKGDSFECGHMIRANTAYGKKALVRRLRSLFRQIQGTIVFSDDYSAWEYKVYSPLRETMIDAFEEMYGKRPIVTTIHAGLECGILAEKIHGADMVSFGPDMSDVHTPNERLSLASAKRCWEYLLLVLCKLK